MCGGRAKAAAGSKAEFSFLYDLTTAPCFRESSLLALGGGLSLGALRLYKTRDAMRAGESMVKSGCGVAVLSWCVGSWGTTGAAVRVCGRSWTRC